MATTRDYYEVLGVAKSASADEIKRAYRKKALEFHPDKTGGDDTKFKEASEAYEVLSDPQKKAGYDQFGHTGAQGNPFGGQQAGGAGFEGFDFSQFTNGGGFGDIFDMFMGGSGGGRREGSTRGRDLELGLTIEFKEAVFGTTRDVNFELEDSCDRCHGSTAEPGSKLTKCKTCDGSGQVTRVQNTILGAMRQQSVCSTCRGRGEIPEQTCSKCGGRGVVRTTKKLDIKVPAGIDNGSTIRVTGQGAAPVGAPGGGTKGDLYVHIRVRASHFRREGQQIISETKIPMVEAALGTEVPVETVDGKVTLKVPAGTQSGRVIKLSGKGVPYVNSSRRGDHLVTVIVETPGKLSPKQRQLLEDFAKESGGRKHFWER